MTYAEEKAARAKALFLEGYNCAQAVCLAFAPEIGLPEAELTRLSAAFGGGMGRLREVCGAVSGAFMVLGALYGAQSAESHSAKAALYAHVQVVAAEVKKQNGSIICRELLGQNDTTPVPEARTEAYYKKRPCPLLIAEVAGILASYLAAQESEK